MVGLVEKLFVAMVGIAALVSSGLSSAEDRRFTIPFLGSRVMIKYESRWTGEGEGLDSYIAEAPRAKKFSSIFMSQNGAWRQRLKVYL